MWRFINLTKRLCLGRNLPIGLAMEFVVWDFGVGAHDTKEYVGVLA